MTTEPQEPTWLDPDPVECARAFFDGNVVEIELAGSTGRHTLTDRTQLHSLCGARYRVISPKPKTYTNLQAAEAYFAGKEVRHESLSKYAAWSHRYRNPIIHMDGFAAFTGGWLIRDDDPRETLTMHSNEVQIVTKPVPRQVDVHEALRVYVAGGVVCSPRGLEWNRKDAMFCARTEEFGKPWTVLEEPK